MGTIIIVVFDAATRGVLLRRTDDLPFTIEADSEGG